MTRRSRVLSADGFDRAKGLQNLLEAFDLHKEGTIALKANYNSDDPIPASTHPETLRILAEFLKKNSRNLIIAERSGMGITQSVLKNRGELNLSRRIGFKLLDLESIAPEDWYDVQAEGLHWETRFQNSQNF